MVIGNLKCQKRYLKILNISPMTGNKQRKKNYHNLIEPCGYEHSTLISGTNTDTQQRIMADFIFITMIYLWTSHNYFRITNIFRILIHIHKWFTANLYFSDSSVVFNFNQWGWCDVIHFGRDISVSLNKDDNIQSLRIMKRETLLLTVMVEDPGFFVQSVKIFDSILFFNSAIDV